MFTVYLDLPGGMLRAQNNKFKEILVSCHYFVYLCRYYY
jgi:hypothetical protein